jgi:hypothetical protein
MERNEAGLRRSLQPGAKNHHLTILAQLLQAIERMEHIDDVFLWLANQMVPQLGIDSLQIWTTQVTQSQQILQSLRATSLYDKTIPQHVVINSSIEEAAYAIASKQQNIPARTLDDIFSFHHANLLKRYGLYYYAGCFHSSNTTTPLPKNQKMIVPAKVPTTIVTLVFLKQPGSPDLVPTINLLLEQTLLIAESHGLLSITSVNETSPLVSTPQSSLPALYVPRRTRSNTSMRSSSPFSNTVSISNKVALTFYGAIDGNRTIVEIAAAKKMSAREITAAVQILLQEKHIQLYTREGHPVDSEVLLRSI